MLDGFYRKRSDLGQSRAESGLNSAKNKAFTSCWYVLRPVWDVKVFTSCQEKLRPIWDVNMDEKG